MKQIKLAVAQTAAGQSFDAECLRSWVGARGYDAARLVFDGTIATTRTTLPLPPAM